MAERDPNEAEDEDLREGDEGEDAGRIDDEGGDESQTGQESEGTEAEERVDRRNRRDDTLRSELIAEREHRARVEARLAELEGRQQQRQQPQEESDEQFNARIAHLDPEQRYDLKLDRLKRNSERLVALSAFASADRADKAAYDSRANLDPIYKKYAARVEETMKAARARGYLDIDRETALNLVYGQDKRMNAGKLQDQSGARRPSQQTRPPASGRGDQQRGDQRTRRYAANDMSPEAVLQRLSAPDAYI